MEGLVVSDFDDRREIPVKSGEMHTEGEAAQGVSPGTRLYIGKSAPWLQFLGIIGFTGCGIIALFGIAAVVIPAFYSMSGNMGFTAYRLGLAVGSLVTYLVLTLLLFFHSRFLFNMGRAARAYNLQGQPRDFDVLVFNLRRWSRFIGIVSILLLILVIVVLIDILV